MSLCVTTADFEHLLPHLLAHLLDVLEERNWWVLTVGFISKFNSSFY